MFRGELDPVLLVERLARRQPIYVLPRRSVPTLATGVQLLLDVSPAMMPFRDDILALIRQLRQTVGVERGGDQARGEIIFDKDAESSFGFAEKYEAGLVAAAAIWLSFDAIARDLRESAK